MTVLENLMVMPMGQMGERIWASWFCPRAVKQHEAEIKDRALEVLDFLDLLHLKDEYAANLSGGQRKLLELARAMMVDPTMVLLDEPGAGVNPTLMRKLVGYIERLCEEKGMTFLIIEHGIDLVMSLCNPVIVMSEGRRLTEGPPRR